MEKRWEIKEQPNNEVVKTLMDELKVPQTTAYLLAQRGISTFDEAKSFFRPELSHLHDPFLMLGMEQAVDRINVAINTGEKILIYGDYDVDGTTSVSLVYSFLKKFYDNLEYYIPDRYAEGYGVSKQGIDYAAKNNFTLIIALDCGVKAVEKIQYAKDIGVEFIVCDHHLPGQTLPPAIAVLDPKQPACNYPYKELSGCGIGYKLMQALSIKNNIDTELLLEFIDLTAISIACDIVPITGENRVLAHYGLKQLNRLPRKGITAIREINQLQKPFTITDLVFIVGPRINAAGRISHAKSAVELLISDEDSTAALAGKTVDEHNQNRREIDLETTQEALQMIEENPDWQKAKSSVLFNPKWHKGVVGIVASRVIEQYYRPTIILTESNGVATGSARSVKGFNVYKAIEECSDLLEQFGGHKYAAGLTMKTENIFVFREKFEEIVSSSIQPQMLIPQIEIDAEIDFDEITPKLYRLINEFAPFGPANMKPNFVTKNVRNAGYTKAVGETGDHLKLDVVQGRGNTRLSGIAFEMGGLANSLCKPNQLFQVVYQIDENEWQGEKSLQLKVKDIKLQ